MQIRKWFAFEAAHVLPQHPGRCAQLHGHSYRVEVTLEGPLQASGPAAGMVMDFDALSLVVSERIIAELDHRSLNDVIDNPTAENIAIWMWRQLAPELPALAELAVWETQTACAVLRRGDQLDPVR